MTIGFQLEGQKYLGLNGGAEFKFNQAISFQIMCDYQEEIDYYWDKLSDGGDPNAQQCGWLKDRYNLSWQVIPKLLPLLMKDCNQKKSQSIINAMLQMTKINIDELQTAYNYR